ncbi:hypothetical protein G3I24_15375, partial [Micromonospora aurantiaca]|nr:hypothetical protein [Micromonospora aurantiaca]
KHLAEAVDPLIEELRARPDRDEVKATMSQIAETAYSDVAKRMDEFSRRFEDVHDDVRKRIENIHEEVAKRVDGALEEFTAQVDLVSRRVES